MRHQFGILDQHQLHDFPDHLKNISKNNESTAKCLGIIRDDENKNYERIYLCIHNSVKKESLTKIRQKKRKFKREIKKKRDEERKEELSLPTKSSRERTFRLFISFVCVCE